MEMGLAIEGGNAGKNCRWSLLPKIVIWWSASLRLIGPTCPLTKTWVGLRAEIVPIGSIRTSATSQR